MRFKRIGRWAIALTSMVTGACSPLSALDSLVPTDTYTAETGVRYGPGERGYLDIYRPAGHQRPSPVIIFFYGGSWKSGARADYRFVGEAFASRGFVTVIPDYRLFPTVKFPEFLVDNARAVAWVQANIARYGGDKQRLFLAGHSAGAYNAAMLGVQPKHLQDAGGEADGICGVMSLAGPISFDPTTYDSVKEIFTPIEDSDRTRPAKLVRPGAPPFLLIHGKGDTTVYPENAIEFDAAMKAAGNSSTVHLVPKIGHYRIIASLASPLSGWLPSLAERMAAFARAQRPC